jgi:hypothetical protein
MYRITLKKSRSSYWLSIYGLLIFLCMPIYSMVSNIYDFDKDTLVELQEKGETESEKTKSEKDSFEKDKTIVSNRFSDIKNTSFLATSVHHFKLNDVSIDVVTPPPERC